ncbi:unnamed protein product [Caenorhabditis brenneri]
MPKVKKEKFILVSVDEDGDSIQTVRKLRRYLANHKLKHICSSSPEEMKDYLDVLQKNHLVFQNNYDDQQDDDMSSEVSQQIIPTNQEILEQWAKGTFPESSDAMKLLFGSTENEESTQDFLEQEQENTIIDTPHVSVMHSTESEAPNDPTIPDDGKEDNQEMTYCLLCDSQVRIGRNRNTRTKRQAEHVIKIHARDEFFGVEIDKRYQCMRCDKKLPVSKSPCEHMSEYHNHSDVEIEFRDLWTKEQTSIFNSVLEACFERHLPVPRSRRIRNGNAWVIAPKAAYKILLGDEVVQINTLSEKTRSVVEKNHNVQFNLEEEDEEEEKGPSVEHRDTVRSSEDDELYIHDEVDYEDFEFRMDDHEYTEGYEKKFTSN